MKRWKIFAGLAAALAALAVVAAETHGTSIDLYLHDTYFVVPTPQVALIFGVLSAVVCFGALRLTPHRPNHLLGLGGFALVAFSCSVLLVLSTFRNWQDSQHIDWQVYVLAVAGSSFALGFVVLSASLVWTLACTLVRIARTHDKTRLGG
jgi:hypothetical protein